MNLGWSMLDLSCLLYGRILKNRVCLSEITKCSKVFIEHHFLVHVYVLYTMWGWGNIF